jgi:hypothetical protein
MAYLVDLAAQLCPCGKRATVQVFNRRDTLQGLFCRRCGEARVRELTTAENLKAGGRP